MQGLNKVIGKNQPAFGVLAGIRGKAKLHFCCGCLVQCEHKDLRRHHDLPELEPLDALRLPGEIESGARKLCSPVRLDDAGQYGFAREVTGKPFEVRRHLKAQLDLLTSISGVRWEDASAGRGAGSYGGVSTYFLGRGEFIANKRASGRKKDLADLEALGEE
jgi:hypothetical protein